MEIHQNAEVAFHTDLSIPLYVSATRSSAATSKEESQCAKVLCQRLLLEVKGKAFVRMSGYRIGFRV